MNIILIILLVVAILIAFLLFIALVTRKHYSIERDVIINKPHQEVYDYVKLLKNQEAYSVWVRLDPNVQLKYTGTDGVVGFTSTWEGNKQAGKGEQEITQLVNGNRVTIEVRFEKPFKNVAHTYMTTTAIAPDQTKVNWKMVGKNKFPLNLMNLVIDGLLGKDLAKSLNDLKLILEKP